ncbi:MAG: hypothetical protein WBL93_09530 [Lutisporaceae bacterium]
MSTKIYRSKDGIDIKGLMNALEKNSKLAVDKTSKRAVIVIGSINCINKIYKDCREQKFIYLELPDKMVYQGNNTVYFKTSELTDKFKYKVVSYPGEALSEGEIHYSEIFDGMAVNPECLKLLNKEMNLFSQEDIKTFVPLLYISCNSQSVKSLEEQKELEIISSIYMYSQLRYSEQDIIFIRTGYENAFYIEDKTCTVIDNSLCDVKLMQVPSNIILEKCIELHNNNSVFLGNHQCYYRKENSEFEIEYKFNMEKPADPWNLIMGIYREIKDGLLPNYILEYKDEFQKWDYYNHLFEVTGPEQEIGYISFLPLTNGKYTIKRKFYKEDQLKRIETHTRNVEVPTTPEDYLKEHYNVQYKAYPPFRRVRYDINLESLKSGNVFGIFFDHISVEEKDNILMQCEIEYLRTRSLFSNDLFMEELNEVLEWTKNFFNKNNVKYNETFYSKLSFMRDTFK